MFGDERLADRVPGSVFGEVVAYELELVEVPVGKVGEESVGEVDGRLKNLEVVVQSIDEGVE